MDESVFLKYVDVPFAISVTAFLVLPQIVLDPISALTYFTIITGTLASVLELADPVGRFLSWYTYSQFKDRKYYPKERTDGESIDIKYYIMSALTSGILQKPKDRITGMLYLIIIMLLNMYKLVSDGIMGGNYDIALFIGLLISTIVVLIKIMKETYRYPRQVDTVVLYYLKIRKLISQGDAFEKMQAALENGDWVTARVWFSRSIDDKDFTPVPLYFPKGLKEDQSQY